MKVQSRRLLYYPSKLDYAAHVVGSRLAFEKNGFLRKMKCDILIKGIFIYILNQFNLVTTNWEWYT